VPPDPCFYYSNTAVGIPLQKILAMPLMTWDTDGTESFASTIYT